MPPVVDASDAAAGLLAGDAAAPGDAAGLLAGDAAAPGDAAAAGLAGAVVGFAGAAVGLGAIGGLQATRTIADAANSAAERLNSGVIVPPEMCPPNRG